jgi:hypothetical protein
MKRNQRSRNVLREPDPEAAATDDELDLVAEELAEVVRNCMRAAASMSPTPPTHQATHHLVILLDRLEKQAGIEPFRLVSRAVALLTPDRQPTPTRRTYTGPRGPERSSSWSFRRRMALREGVSRSGRVHSAATSEPWSRGDTWFARGSGSATRSSACNSGEWIAIL